MDEEMKAHIKGRVRDINRSLRDLTDLGAGDLKFEFENEGYEYPRIKVYLVEQL